MDNTSFQETVQKSTEIPNRQGRPLFSDEQNIVMRPTLVLGLGGTGALVVTALKARMEERLRPESNYHRVIKFLCFDTADDAEPAAMPDQPERTVSLTREYELSRISDVPLYQLMQARDSNRAIARLLPEVLYSTQIDQGAQQIRRLGRIALFYHYNRTVRSKLSETIDALRHPAVMGRQGVVKRAGKDKELFVNEHNRLRVFIVSSLCGGTGSGTFLDMAYLVRNLAGKEQPIEVIGMLLLPEAFPEINTTGLTRIRANAYAALLDLEYYMQPTADGRILYQEEFPDEMVEVRGNPFTICYMVSRSNLENKTLKDKHEIAPVLAEGLYTLIATPLGVQTDSVLDNVRARLTAYSRGYRAFYSGIGIAQIVYPANYARRRYTQIATNSLIMDYILRDPPFDRATLHDFDDLIKEIRTALFSKVPQEAEFEEFITYPLQNLRSEISRSSDLRSDLESAFRDTSSQFEARFVAQMRDNLADARKAAAAYIAKTTRNYIDRALKVDAKEAQGLRWTAKWLNVMIEQVNTLLARRVMTIDPSSDRRAALNRELSAISEVETSMFGAERRMQVRARRACANLKTFFESEVAERALDEKINEVLSNVRAVLESQRAQVNEAISFWTKQIYIEPLPFPKYSEFTRSVLSQVELDDQLDREFDSMMSSSTELGNLLTDLENNFKQADGLSMSLEVGRQSSAYNLLVAFCETRFQSSVSQNVITEIQNLPLTQQRDLLENLHKQAEPLLRYETGKVQSLTVSHIKVIGADTNENATFVRDRSGDITDVKPAATGDPTLVTYLITHHGIPAYALSNFGEYQDAYKSMIGEPNAIFHLDNYHERDPYDPGATHFVNLAEFGAIFARALAYNWIIRLQPDVNMDRGKTPQFAFDAKFFDHFKKLCGNEIQMQGNQMEELRAQGEDIPANLVAIETIQHHIEDLSQFLKLQKQDRYRPTDPSDEPGTKRPEMIHYLMHTSKDIPADTLARAYRSLEYRAVQNRFMAAFQSFLKETLERDERARTLLEERLKSFLRQRGYLRKDDQGNNLPDMPRMYFGEEGQTSHALEVRLCQFLLEYYRIDRKRLYDDRLPPAFFQDEDADPNRI